MGAWGCPGRAPCRAARSMPRDPSAPPGPAPVLWSGALSHHCLLSGCCALGAAGEQHASPDAGCAALGGAAGRAAECTRQAQAPGGAGRADGAPGARPPHAAPPPPPRAGRRRCCVASRLPSSPPCPRCCCRNQQPWLSVSAAAVGARMAAAAGLARSAERRLQGSACLHCCRWCMLGWLNGCCRCIPAPQARTSGCPRARRAARRRCEFQHPAFSGAGRWRRRTWGNVCRLQRALAWAACMAAVRWF